MKKIIAGILTGLMVLSLVGCSVPKKEEKSPLDGKTIIKVGEVIMNSSEYDSHRIKADNDTKFETYYDKDNNEYEVYNNFALNYVGFDTLSDLLLNLESKRLSMLWITESQANYAMKLDKSLAAIKDDWNVFYSMGIKSDNKALRDDLNNAINELKDNGKLKELAEKHLNTLTPENITLPKFDGAKTVKVGITGAIPPLDYISDAGIPAGFNMALLSEISNILKINIEPVTVEINSRLVALATGKIDAIFFNSAYNDEIQDTDSFIFTDIYFNEEAYMMFKKSNDFTYLFKELYPNYAEEQLTPKSFE